MRNGLSVVSRILTGNKRPYDIMRMVNIFLLRVTIISWYFYQVKFDTFQSPVQQEHTDQLKRQAVKVVKRVPSAVKEKVPVHFVVPDFRLILTTLNVVCPLFSLHS